MATVATNTSARSPSPTTNANNCWIPLVRNYTGTADQPDVVSVFLKSVTGKVKISDEQCANQSGHDPRDWITALPRIRKAAKVMSKGFTTSGEFWNGFKNFSRGMIQLVPLLGNGVLYLYDKLRTCFCTHPRLRAALSDQQEPVAGIAFDGKPVFTLPLSTVQRFLSEAQNKSEDSLLVMIHYLWLGLKSNAIDRRSTYTTRELAGRMCQMLSGPPVTHSTNSRS